VLDTRRHLQRFYKKGYNLPFRFIFSAFSFSFIIALSISFIPEYPISKEANYTMFILLFAAGLWISEAIPAFAVSLLVVALEIILLGFNDFNFSSGSNEWKYYLSPWSSPLIFLFLAGFIMALAASKIKLDVWLAKKVLFLVGENPRNIMVGILFITFFLSMFISNTATAAMMLTLVLPLVNSLKDTNQFKKALLLAIVIAANLGGMGTIIGTPPNAIAVGALGENAPSFLGWMLIALPPALITLVILSFIIYKLYPSNELFIDLNSVRYVEHYDDSTKDFSKEPMIVSWKKKITVVLFITTVLLWLTTPLHHIPIAVISFLPIIGFTLFGIIDGDDINKIRWDVIILIVGGLSLGLAVTNTGLDKYIATLIPIDGYSALIVMFIFSYIIVIISNFMSNTAATNIMLPIVIALAVSISQEATLPLTLTVALCASLAMCLPVSTPPNAVVYSAKVLGSREFLLVGIIGGLIGPLIVVSWLSIIF
jgi:sodium-dependent dicarboxylate transporter 2/3/5